MIRRGKGRRFSPRPLPTFITLALLVLLLSLGRWQLNRADEKRILFDSFDKGAASEIYAGVPDNFMAGQNPYMRIRVYGKYESNHQFLLDGMTNENGVAGYHVLTPFRVEDGRHLIVNRGWVPVGPDRNVRPDIGVDDMLRHVTGQIGRLPRAGLKLDSVASEHEDWPRVVLYPTMPELAGMLDKTLQDYTLLLDPAEDAGFVRSWEPTGVMRPERHIGYAVQWFALAAALTIIYLVVNLKPKEQRDD